tara:strand:- start:2185 stop:2286 length:102 start_codon:yes stop_codon:yes gene_type:complete
MIEKLKESILVELGLIFVIMGFLFSIGFISINF